MALVMLPCDMPWWPKLQFLLTEIATVTTPKDLAKNMFQIYSMCNVGLDPDEHESTRVDDSIFKPLVKYLENEMTPNDREDFFSSTLPYISQAALALKQNKSVMGLCFSLQQQVDSRKISHEFVSSLVAHSFFSSFPKRTSKTHPTLQDFNFSNFFLQLDQSFQQVKFRCFLHYFNCLAKFGYPQEPILISRQVMTGREWLTIEDWLECNLPLCPLSIKHDARLEWFESSDSLLVCSCSPRIGGHVLNTGSSRECIQFCECPELIALLLFVEALEDNEVCIVENVLKVAKISDVRQRSKLELLEKPTAMYLCLMDAENYTRLPLSQYEEDNVLRELNKALLGFRQKQQHTQQILHYSRQHSSATAKRLSPIGESFSSTPPPEMDHEYHPYSPNARVCELSMTRSGGGGGGRASEGSRLAPPSNGKWIMLGSSGECLPISRHQRMPVNSTSNHSDPKEEDVFYSAYSSFQEDEDDDRYDDVFLEDNETGSGQCKYGCELKTPERRHTFAQRLKEALQREQSNGSSDSSYAVGISVAGSSLSENNIRMRRGGSRGFMLEDSFGSESSPKTEKHKARRLEAFTRGNSSRYSFSTEYTSELEEVYEQLSRWLDESDLSTAGLGEEASGRGREEEATKQRLRDRAVVQFAGSLLKRTLSESFVGVPLTDHRDELEETDYSRPESRLKRDLKIQLAARSLSLELQKHKHKLAAQLVSVLAQQEAGVGSSELLPVVTGNWGCGTRQLGDPQLKLLVQWLAASVAGTPALVYCTYGHYKLLKLDTVCRVILDRKWSVGELVSFILRYVQLTLGHCCASQEADTLFEYIISRDHAAV